MESYASPVLPRCLWMTRTLEIHHHNFSFLLNGVLHPSCSSLVSVDDGYPGEPLTWVLISQWSYHRYWRPKLQVGLLCFSRLCFALLYVCVSGIYYICDRHFQFSYMHMPLHACPCQHIDSSKSNECKRLTAVESAWVRDVSHCVICLTSTRIWKVLS